MITKRTVDEIYNAVRIDEVIGDFVTLKRRGASFVACCPFHNEKTPSFYVTPSKGLYKCFGCGKAGGAVNFLMEHESLSYAEALKYLAKKYNIQIEEEEDSPEELIARQKSESLMIVCEFARDFFVQNLGTPEGRVGYAYFRSRGLEDATIGKFGLGWAPEGRSGFVNAARAKGYKEEYLVDAGLCIRTEDGKLLDCFHNRVTFPIMNTAGKVIAFTSRTLSNDKNVPKYVNSRETEIFQKKFTLFGLHLAKAEIHRRDKVILVEGQMDVISMHQKGLTNVVASSGTSLTVEQVRLLRKFTENVTIIYDGDSAGIHAALRGIDLVLQGGMNVKVVLLPDGDDPDSFCRKHSLEEVEKFVTDNEKDFISFKSSLLLAGAGNDPVKKASLINDMADTVANIPDPIKQSVYVQMVAADFGIAEEKLFERIKQTRSKAVSRALETSGKEADPRFDRERVEMTPLPSGSMLEDVTLAPCEEELLGFLLKNGSDSLIFDKDSPYYGGDEPPRVAEYIASALEEDGVVFSNEQYRKVYDKYFSFFDAGMTQEQIIARLVDDPDPQVVDVSKRFASEEYVITVQRFSASLTAETTVLATYVPRAIIAYGRARVAKEIKGLERQLKGTAGDGVAPILKKIMELNKLKTTLTKKLGRV